ncbi:unnamed protein product [Caenorhabditis auriculariae]|uniref:Uncharacterized protein n=1 Tax=Caenorhabditis auriculariae TaxID=2777116 RepID=A0A8S1HFK8_9PELO|nr:unnamed protein product [Caenorhabditis auriculariae]
MPRFTFLAVIVVLVSLTPMFTAEDTSSKRDNLTSNDVIAEKLSFISGKDVLHAFFKNTTAAKACSVADLCAPHLPLITTQLPLNLSPQELLVVERLSTPINASLLNEASLGIVSAVLLNTPRSRRGSDEFERILYSFAYTVQLQMQHIIEREGLEQFK